MGDRLPVERAVCGRTAVAFQDKRARRRQKRSVGSEMRFVEDKMEFVECIMRFVGAGMCGNGERRTNANGCEGEENNQVDCNSNG